MEVVTIINENLTRFDYKTIKIVGLNYFQGRKVGHSTLKTMFLEEGPIVYDVQKIDGTLLFVHISH